MATEQRGGRTLDVRTVDGEPFGEIMDALDDLGEGETLELINNFEPVPLYAALDARGFTHETEQVDDGEWHVRVSRS